jgi:hypothetical protein
MASPDNNTLPPDGLYQDYWEFTLKENPTFATYLGDHRYDNWLEDVSSEAYEKRIDRFGKYLAELKGFKKPTSGEDRLNYDLFKRELSLQIDGAKYHPYLLSMTQQTGPHIDLPQLTTYHPFKILQDYVNYVSRLTQFRRVFDQTIANLKTGIGRRPFKLEALSRRSYPNWKLRSCPHPRRAGCTSQSTRSRLNFRLGKRIEWPKMLAKRSRTTSSPLTPNSSTL